MYDIYFLHHRYEGSDQCGLLRTYLSHFYGLSVFWVDGENKTNLTNSNTTTTTSSSTSTTSIITPTRYQRQCLHDSENVIFFLTTHFFDKVSTLHLVRDAYQQNKNILLVMDSREYRLTNLQDLQTKCPFDLKKDFNSSIKSGVVTYSSEQKSIQELLVQMTSRLSGTSSKPSREFVMLTPHAGTRPVLLVSNHKGPGADICASLQAELVVANVSSWWDGSENECVSETLNEQMLQVAALVVVVLTRQTMYEDRVLHVLREAQNLNKRICIIYESDPLRGGVERGSLMYTCPEDLKNFCAKHEMLEFKRDDESRKKMMKSILRSV